MADRPLRYYLLILLVFGLVAGVYVYESGLVYEVTPPPDDYERVTVTAYDSNGTELAAVRVRVADTREKRYVGLSNTTDLAMDEGMLFVHESEGSHGYVMRKMDFPIDIIFIDSDERVTRVHHAPVPDESYERTYSGRAKWVLEVPRGWANQTGLSVGDRIEIPPAARETN